MSFANKSLAGAKRRRGASVSQALETLITIGGIRHARSRLLLGRAEIFETVREVAGRTKSFKKFVTPDDEFAEAHRRAHRSVS